MLEKFADTNNNRAAETDRQAKKTAEVHVACCMSHVACRMLQLRLGKARKAGT